jgi:hypothetical protein
MGRQARMKRYLKWFYFPDEIIVVFGILAVRGANSAF